MATMWTTCPKCLRPIETDFEEDGDSVICPGCDSPVAVPRPVLLNITNWIWPVIGLLMLLPFAIALGFVDYYNNRMFYAPAGFLSVLMLVPSILLLRRYRAAWLVIIVLICLVLTAGISATLMGVVMFLFASFGTAFLWSGIPTTVICITLLILLAIRPMRDWCQL